MSAFEAASMLPERGSIGRAAFGLPGVVELFQGGRSLMEEATLALPTVLTPVSRFVLCVNDELCTRRR